MDVEEVQVLLLGDPEHLGAEGDGVGRVLEQGVLDDGDEVDVDVLVVLVLDGDRALVGDEVGLVPPLRQLHAEAGGEYAASSHGGVAGYPNFHAVPFLL